MSTIEIQHHADLNTVRDIHKYGTLRQLLALPALWAHRSLQRRQLRELLTRDNRLLADIGLHRLDVRREAGKRFWQA